MKKVYHLPHCGTCQDIIRENALDNKGFSFQDIKTDQIKPAELDALKKLAGSYEALFSRKAIKYKTLGLKDKQLTEDDYRKLILEEYTFLKRPVIVQGKSLFAGSDKKTREALKAAL
jgi:arsenate reductase